MTRIEKNKNTEYIVKMALCLNALLTACFFPIFYHCSSPSPVKKTNEYHNELYVDPGDIADSLLPITIPDDTNRIRAFESELNRNDPDSIDLHSCLDIIFIYHDPLLIPLYYRIIRSKNFHTYFKFLSIWALGEIADAAEFDNLLAIWETAKNDLVREYLASAMGKIANSSHLSVLEGLIKNERNAYIRKTLIAATRRATGGRRATLAYLPLFDTTGFCKLRMFPSDKPRTEFALRARKKLDKGISQSIPMAKDRIFPHMQYKLCRSIYDKVKQPFESFGLPGVWHVGEDSGWLFAGLPVHSIMDGRVVLIQHEESWGCLVCIESLLPDSQIVSSYYGHLSHNLDVYIGQRIQKGDKIGEIGPPFTFQNGGYRSHLHLGIEKASFKKALIAGYHEDIEHWFDPMVFIKN